MQEILFWLFFLLFNASVFAINTFLRFERRILIPFRHIGKSKRHGVFLDYDADFYRICLDLSMLILLTRWLKFGDTVLVFISIYYFLIMLYNAYHYSFSKLYQVIPVLINDIRLMKNGIAILWAESKFNFLFYSVLSLGILGLLSFSIYEYLSFSSELVPNQYFYSITFLFFLFVAIGIFRKGFYSSKLDLEYRILIMASRILTNLMRSHILIKKRRVFVKIEPREEIRLSLKQKPNVFFLFIESYGEILLNKDELKPLFLDYFENKAKKLASDGWHVKSNVSESISMVGPSWLAYTTALTGLKVRTNFEYEYLLNQATDHKLGSLTKLFRNEGYNVYNINDSKHKKGINVPFKQMEDLFGINKWILKDDINFQGTNYGFAESAPDQYVLNFSYDQILTDSQDPFFLFYLTKNSHSPFISPHSIVEDWRNLNTGKSDLVGFQFLQKPNFEDYFNSIKYQWDMLEDLILKRGNDDDVFVLYGDHQPHDLAKLEEHGLNTLVHIISKNKSFVDGFANYGFSDSIDELKDGIKHESFYTAFLREFSRTFSDSNQVELEHKPNGIQI